MVKSSRMPRKKMEHLMLLGEKADGTYELLSTAYTTAGALKREAPMYLETDSYTRLQIVQVIANTQVTQAIKGWEGPEKDGEMPF